MAKGGRYLCNDVNVTIKKSERQQLEFSRREIELLQLIANGCTLPEQADKMCLGQHTIRSYRKRLYLKLDVHNTAQLLHKAKELNLV